MKIDGFKVDGIANIEHAYLRIEDLRQKNDGSTFQQGVTWKKVQ